MSDDLERAISGWNDEYYRWGVRYRKESGTAEIFRRDDVERADSATVMKALQIGPNNSASIYECKRLQGVASIGAALLSFLDMDEAGVERIARALAWQCRGPRYPSETADTFWCDLVEDEHKEEWGVVATAVLTELRKMASPTQRDEGE